MRILMFVFFISVCLFTISGQVKELKQADEYFFDKDYQKAIKSYLQIEKDGKALYYVTHQIAECYRKLDEHDLAIEWYLKAIKYPEVEEETYYALSQEFKWFEKYKDADVYIQEYNKSAKKEGDIIRINYERLIPELKSDSSNYTIRNLEVLNSKYSEIGPVIYMQNLVFASNREVFSPIKRTDIRDGSGFYNLFISKRADFSSFSVPDLFDKNLNSKFNDGPVAFSDNYTKAFVTRNIELKTSNRMNLNILMSNKNKEEWSDNLTPIFFTQDNSSYMDAFLTNDKKRIFYVSDRPGGYGGYDIYYSYLENGFLSTPINLGPNINTAGNEMSPFIGEDGKLYFSSDRYDGLGGFDIFFALPEEDNFSTAFNMGFPLNTAKDDMGLIMLQDNKSGYFVSNREGGIGGDDIYAFNVDKLYNIQKYIGEIGDVESGDPIKDVDIILHDESNHEVMRVKTNEEGKFFFYCKDNIKGSITVKKSFYESVTKKLADLVDLKNNDNAIFLFLKKY